MRKNVGYDQEQQCVQEVEDRVRKNEVKRRRAGGHM